MSQTITGHYDGKVIIPEKPVKLPVGKRLRIIVDLAPEGNGKKSGKPLKFTGVGQFDSGITDLASIRNTWKGSASPEE